jgi:hypothetical protein
MKKTFKQLQDLDLMIGKLYKKDKTLQDSKFGYAYKRFSEKNYFPIYKEYVQALTDIRVDNALEDPTTKEILRTPDSEGGRGFKYSKEGLKAVMKAENALEDSWEAKEFDVIPYIVALENLPVDLTEEQREAMQGILIEEKE